MSRKPGRLRISDMILATACVVGCLTFSSAQSTGNDSMGENSPFASAPHPKPPSEIVRLKSMIGTWDALEHWEKVEGFAPGGDGKGIYTVADGPGGMSILIDYKAISGPFPTYSGHGILSWELDQKVYRMAWVQPIVPGVSIETGRFEGPELILSYEIEEKMGQKYVVKNEYTDWTDTTLTITSHLIDVTGRPIKTLTMTLKKRQ
jgi:hypothetical protein